MSVMLEPSIDIYVWAQASWTQGMVGKLIQDQSWLLNKAAGLRFFPERKIGVK
jgi:hypothetical protein